MFKAPRGTYDILPDKVTAWQKVEAEANRLCRLYNYKEIRTPLFESTELFQRSVGESTDIVGKEMYDFKDRGGRALTLRPEGTASVVRAYVEHKLFAQEPLSKLFYIGQMFRYERPQAGRHRQFVQFGAEVFGEESVALEAEVIALAMQYFDNLGLPRVKVEINNIGTPDSRAEYQRELVKYFERYKYKLTPLEIERLQHNPLRILDSKVASTKEIVANAPSILDCLDSKSKQSFEQLQALLDTLDIPYRVNDRIVRGLDYYTGTAFEFLCCGDESESSPSQVLGGGGRYTGLVKQLGGPDVSGIGFGIGLDRVLLALEETNFNSSLDCYVIVMDPEEGAGLQAGVSLVQQLRASGISADMNYLNRKLKAEFKTANILESKFILLIGSEELAQQSVQIKDLNTGEQQLVQLDKAVFYISDRS